MSLFVRESGPVSAPTIVFLHGGGVSGWSWQPQIEAFPDYHLLVPDLPEHGRSLAEAPFTIPDAAERVANLIRDRGHGGRAHVIGLSLGAQIAIQLLAAAPEIVDHALLSGALVRGLPGASLVRPYHRRVYAVSEHPGTGSGQHAILGHPRGLLPTVQRGYARLDDRCVDAHAGRQHDVPPAAGAGSGESGCTGDGWKPRIRTDVRLCTRRCCSDPRGPGLCGEGCASQLAAGRSWLVQLDSPRLDRRPGAAG